MVNTRSGDESIKICAGQGVNQEQFLTLVRMDIMSVLLKLIEPNSATPEKLQEIGRELLAVRSKINAEITRIIMLKEAKALPQARSSECDCGILKEISDGLQEVQDASKGYQKCTVTLFSPQSVSLSPIHRDKRRLMALRDSSCLGILVLL